MLYDNESTLQFHYLYEQVKMVFKSSYWNFHGLRKDIEKWSGVRVAEMKHDYAAPEPTTAKDLLDMEKRVC